MNRDVSNAVLLRNRLARTIPRVALGGVTVVATASLVSLLARWHWAAELATHFRIQYVAILLLCLVGLTPFHRWYAASLTAVLLMWHGVAIFWIYLPASGVPSEAPPLRIITANVRTSNRNYAKFLSLVRRVDPDVVLVQEIDQAWAKQLQTLEPAYSHVRLQPRHDHFGMACLARGEIDFCHVFPSAASGLPVIRLRLTRWGQPLTIYGVHTLPPSSAANAHSRDRQLNGVARRVGNTRGSVIVAGDLNVTPWSPAFDDFVDRADLRDSRQGFGVQPTWPRLPWLGRVPIDHVLISARLTVTHRRVGPDVGSDHRPVIAEVTARE